jgi:hypothetical protein
MAVGVSVGDGVAVGSWTSVNAGVGSVAPVAGRQATKNVVDRSNKNTRRIGTPPEMIMEADMFYKSPARFHAAAAADISCK